jgi:glutamate-1-semialdehyde 2,1-aminomutase
LIARARCSPTRPSSTCPPCGSASWPGPLGARAEYRFTPSAPRTGAGSAAAADRELEEFLHLYLLNRGVLITRFHSMALMCPATTEDQVDRHTEAFTEAVEELYA